MIDGPELDAERRGERPRAGMSGPLYPATNAPWVDPTVSGPTVDFIRECFAWSHEVRSADHAAMTRRIALLGERVETVVNLLVGRGGQPSNGLGLDGDWLEHQFEAIDRRFERILESLGALDPTVISQRIIDAAFERGRQQGDADRAARGQSEYDRGVADGRASITLVSDEVLNGRLIPFDVHQQAISNATQNGRVAGFDAGKSIGQAEREAELLEQGWTPPGAVLESVLEPARHEIHAYEVWRDALMMATQHRIGADGDLDETASLAVWFWDRLLEGPPGFQGEYFRPVDQMTERERWERSTAASKHEAAASPADPIDGDETSWGPMPTIDPTNTPIDDPRDAGPY